MYVRAGSLIIFIGLSIVMLLAFASPVLADIWHVYPTDSIQATVDAAADGDRIYVHEGTYDESITIDGKNLTLLAIGSVV